MLIGRNFESLIIKSDSGYSAVVIVNRSLLPIRVNFQSIADDLTTLGLENMYGRVVHIFVHLCTSDYLIAHAL